MSALIERPQMERVRTSVVVPCSHKHVRLLPELVEEIGRQTRRPDEIVIALSGSQTPPLPGHVRLLHGRTASTAGHNRNRGSEAATGTVLIYQDADDLPHPQRVEVIAGLFERYEVEHLMHGYMYTRGQTWSVGHPDQPSDHRPLPIELPPTSVEDAAQRSAYRSEPLPATIVSNGEVAVLRSTWRAAPWPEHAGAGEDQEFNQRIFSLARRTATTILPLVVYRHHYSSFA